MPAVSFGGIDLQPRLPFVNVCPAGGGAGPGEPRSSAPGRARPAPVLAEPPPSARLGPAVCSCVRSPGCLFVLITAAWLGGTRGPCPLPPSLPFESNSLKTGRVPSVGAAGAAPGHTAGLRARCPPRPTGPSAALADRPSVPGGSAPSTDRRRAGAAPPARASARTGHGVAAAAPGSAGSGGPPPPPGRLHPLVPRQARDE